MFGAMPSDFMLFEVSEQPDVEEDEEHSVETADDSDSKWDVNHRSVHERARRGVPRVYLNMPQCLLLAICLALARGGGGCV